ncbi:uncharacterized protein LOC129597698 [Paramacrobiotus metropolitanus]|uniref:uncharacterized protein LOC129597698 n=1 Tax=Paramacrobiotus metropolitanus TaxID=2943436 RepID=UPI00244569AC|nr:uncharacterized protein LOC129597698 [Paramacrobiotus metropolitanus]
MEHHIPRLVFEFSEEAWKQSIGALHNQGQAGQTQTLQFLQALHLEGYENRFKTDYDYYQENFTTKLTPLNHDHLLVLEEELDQIDEIAHQNMNGLLQVYFEDVDHVPYVSSHRALATIHTNTGNN